MILNALGLLVFGWLRLDTTILAPIAVSARYTELDRAQVIDEKRLAEAFPDLASNSRHLVPKWVTEPVVGTGQSLALYGLMLAGFNLVVVFVLSRGIAGDGRRADDDVQPGNDTPL
ncbi:MAG: hypothetical protein JXO22_06785 [Phycisphaerae bacterium]|nr:hypothetical protein [Phycisphaerae bacterium]